MRGFLPLSFVCDKEREGYRVHGRKMKLFAKLFSSFL